MKSGSAYHGGAIGARSDVVWPLMIVARIDGAIQSAWACVPALRVGAVSEGIGAARYIVVEHGDDQLLRVDLYAYDARRDDAIGAAPSGRYRCWPILGQSFRPL